MALVFEADRFRALSLADLDETEMADKAPDWLGAWSWSGPKLVGTRRAKSGEELLASVERSLAGIDTAQRPSWWQDYALNVPDALTRARPVADLAAKHPTQRALIDEAIARTGQPESSLRWLPLVSRRALDWTALIDARTAEPVGYVHLDGF